MSDGLQPFELVCLPTTWHTRTSQFDAYIIVIVVCFVILLTSHCGMWMHQSYFSWDGGPSIFEVWEFCSAMYCQFLGGWFVCLIGKFVKLTNNSGSQGVLIFTCTCMLLLSFEAIRQSKLNIHWSVLTIWTIRYINEEEGCAQFVQTALRT